MKIARRSFEKGGGWLFNTNSAYLYNFDSCGFSTFRSTVCWNMFPLPYNGRGTAETRTMGGESNSPPFKEGLPGGRGGISNLLLPPLTEDCSMKMQSLPRRRGVATVRIRTQKQNSYGNLRHGFLDEPSGEAERTLLFIKRHSCWYLRKPCPYKRRPR